MIIETDSGFQIEIKDKRIQKLSEETGLSPKEIVDGAEALFIAMIGRVRYGETIVSVDEKTSVYSVLLFPPLMKFREILEKQG
jgi:hypothetical protein